MSLASAALRHDRPSPRIRSQQRARGLLTATEALERAALVLFNALPTHRRGKAVERAMGELHELTERADTHRRRANEAHDAGNAAGARQHTRELQRVVASARTRVGVLVRATGRV